MHEIVAGDGLGLGNVDLELVVDALGLGTDEDGVFLRVFGKADVGMQSGIVGER